MNILFPFVPPGLSFLEGTPCHVKAELLPPTQATERTPHPFYNSTAGHVRLHPHVVLPVGSVPRRTLRPRPVRHLMGFWAEFMRKWGWGRLVSRGAWHRALAAERHAQTLSITSWTLEELFQPPGLRRQPGMSSRELHKPRLLVSNEQVTNSTRYLFFCLFLLLLLVLVCGCFFFLIFTSLFFPKL